MAKGIFEMCKKISSDIKGDFGGGSTIDKTFLMSYLITEFKLKKYLEIGVYRGRSFFPCAYAISLNEGKSIGVDPFKAMFAYENDCEDTLKKEIDSFIECTDFEKLYDDVIKYKNKYEYFSDAEFIREPSQSMLKKFEKNKEKFDFIHIDGNHDTENVKVDFEYSYKILNDGGFIVFDDIDWDSVNPIYEDAKKNLIEVFKTETFGILYKKNSANKINDPLFSEKLKIRLNGIYSRMMWVEENSYKIPRVAIGVITYNQNDYIIECLDSLINQEGDFEYKVIVCDDNSQDGTKETIEKYIERLSEKKRSKLMLCCNEENQGSIKNFRKLMNIIDEEDYDYVTFCEGDDYLLSSKKVQTHLDLHLKNPQIAISFNHLAVKWEENQLFEVGEFATNLNGKLSTENLIKENFIANLGNGFYSMEVMRNIKEELYDIYLGDWILNIILSQYGDIYYIPELFNLYRKHVGGSWAGASEEYKSKTLLENLYLYNKCTNFLYDKYFTKHLAVVGAQVSYVDRGYLMKNLIVVDDIFPSPMSGFRYEEFNQILTKIDEVSIVCTGESCLSYTKRGLEELLVEYKQKYVEFADFVMAKTPEIVYEGKVLYGIFLGNAYHNMLPIVEKYKIPFVFTLYPGGSFAINSVESDIMLRKVLKSPYFRKVIVTQKITYKYLVDNKFCDKEKVAFIYGGIVPSNNLEFDIKNKNYYQDGKNSLDICFVAQKYTKNGADKGYDIFVEAAKRISMKSKNVNFHVVGPWDESVIDISGVDKIKFYGLQSQEWFDDFYKKIDIIISPNINNKLGKGWFDGFPTGCVLDAVLRGVASICTDPLNLNENRFQNGRDMIIVEHDIDDVVKSIELLMEDPKLLKLIANNGYNKANKLFSTKEQIIPRIKLLKNEINESFFSKKSADVSGMWTSYLEKKEDQEESELENNKINTNINSGKNDFSRKLKNTLKERLPYPLVRFLKRIHHLWLGMKQI